MPQAMEMVARKAAVSARQVQLVFQQEENRLRSDPRAGLADACTK